MRTRQSGWIEEPLLRDFEGERTDAHRLCTANDGWVERFGRDILISYQKTAARDRLMLELGLWTKNVNFQFSRIFERLLPKQNEARQAPRLLFGNSAENLRTVAMERKLKFGIDFGAGYSVGLFLDQRENRSYAREATPRRLLNCFAYTCSFSVVVAAAGAQTLNVDLSKNALARGRENFALNGLPTNGHRFIADDVRRVLQRTARRGEKFDMIILDPPTFARAPRGKAFRIESDFEELLLLTLQIAERDARILLSTNCATLHERALKGMARHCLTKVHRAGILHRQPRPVDFPAGSGASTVWITLH
jgi:23S rRNA (cytosine1962-C5)-methyltransferase